MPITRPPRGISRGQSRTGSAGAPAPVPHRGSQRRHAALRNLEDLPAAQHGRRLVRYLARGPDRGHIEPVEKRISRRQCRQFDEERGFPCIPKMLRFFAAFMGLPTATGLARSSLPTNPGRSGTTADLPRRVCLPGCSGMFFRSSLYLTGIGIERRNECYEGLGSSAMPIQGPAPSQRAGTQRQRPRSRRRTRLPRAEPRARPH